MKKELVRKELLLEEGAEINLISLVEKPAIEVDFMKFSEAVRVIFTSDEKQIITGPALIPDKLIYRIDESTGEEFEVFFSKETIVKIAEQYLTKFKQGNVNLDHEVPVEEVCLVESWIIEDSEKDKAVALGFTNLPEGTWMVSMKINNVPLWEDIKSGKYKGFSIEGTLVALAIQHNRKVIDNALQEAESLLEKLKELLKNI